MVRLGNTTVVCGIKAEVSEPDLKHPDQGFLGKLILFLCSMRVI
jgi:exosome complex RNA-binding protein Rrp42 (RNase PH superfamily)